MRIMICQSLSYNDIKRNYRSIIDKINLAKAQECDVLVLPELFLVGCSSGGVLQIGFQEKNDEYNKKITQYIKNHAPDITVIYGGISEKQTQIGHSYHNCIFVIGNKSKVFYKRSYCKADKHLFVLQNGVVDNGCIEIDVKGNIELCEVLFYDDIYTIGSLGTLMEAPVFVYGSLDINNFDFNFIKHKLGIISKKTKRAVVFINKVGSYDGIGYPGLSMVSTSKGYYGYDTRIMGCFKEDQIVVDLGDSRTHHDNIYYGIENLDSSQIDGNQFIRFNNKIIEEKDFSAWMLYQSKKMHLQKMIAEKGVKKAICLLKKRDKDIVNNIILHIGSEVLGAFNLSCLTFDNNSDNIDIDKLKLNPVVLDERDYDSVCLKVANTLLDGGKQELDEANKMMRDIDSLILKLYARENNVVILHGGKKDLYQDRHLYVPIDNDEAEKIWSFLDSPSYK